MISISSIVCSSKSYLSNSGINLANLEYSTPGRLRSSEANIPPLSSLNPSEVIYSSTSFLLPKYVDSNISQTSLMFCFFFEK